MNYIQLDHYDTVGSGDGLEISDSISHKLYRRPENSKFSSMCGTPKYQPPEYFPKDGKGRNLKKGRKVDIWGLGMTILEKFGDIKFDSNGLPIIHSYLSNEFKEVLEHALEANPNSRYYAKQLLELPLFKDKDLLSIFKQNGTDNKIINGSITNSLIYYNLMYSLNQTKLESKKVDDKRAHFGFYLNSKEIKAYCPYELNIVKEFNENQNYPNHLLATSPEEDDISSTLMKK
ncbi:hypothetical protein ACTFIY_004859 [Dictyostelium cf. discoideum]